ncbi:MAG: VC0807 family protein [Candidatus Spyradosoma sp.]
MEEPEKKENLLVSLAANIAVPALILTKGAKLAGRFGAELSPAAVLVVALAFPLGYFVWDFLRRRRTNWISVVGFAGTLLTGGIGLFRLSPLWIAVKEASIPLLIAVVMIFSRRLVRTFLFNEKVFDVPAIEASVRERGNEEMLAGTLKRCSRVLTASFLLSAALNFALARILVTTEPEIDSAKFNEEIGEMMALSWPVIVLPCMLFIFAALWILLKGLEKASGLPFERLFRNAPR